MKGCPPASFSFLLPIASPLQDFVATAFTLAWCKSYKLDQKCKIGKPQFTVQMKVSPTYLLPRRHPHTEGMFQRLGLLHVPLPWNKASFFLAYSFPFSPPQSRHNFDPPLQRKFHYE
ncbi:hypothetical protein VNO80_30675 [Phaseolus coccineus]|uniref:Uncharacterized protein n=1 Tax=Phaseolus coccineus TaxID=3886 RepID=A0AAN9LGR1_PHACN